MVWPLIGAGVAAIGSLIGGRKQSKANARAAALQNSENRRLIAEQNAYNDPAAIRKRAEAAGFNPLLFVGPGVGTQGSVIPAVAGVSVMGDAWANAGAAFGAGIAEFGKQQAYQTALEQQNAELRKAVQTATLRPEVPGVYGTAQPVKVGVSPVTAQNGFQLNGTYAGSLAFGDVPAASLATPFIGRNGQVLAFQEGADLEDAASAVPMNAIANLQEDGTLDPGFVDRFFMNAEGLTTAVGRPFFRAAKAVGTEVADIYVGSTQNRYLKPPPNFRIFDPYTRDAYTVRNR